MLTSLFQSMRRAAPIYTALLFLAACTAPWQSFQPGQDKSALIAKLGQPRETYSLPSGAQRLMWSTQPYGSSTTAAEIDARGKIINVKQILTNEEFAQAKIDAWSKQDVLTHFGRPVQTTYFARMQREVWSYRYQESPINYMLYHFYFDTQGILRSTQKTSDPLHDPDRRTFFKILF